MSRSSMSGALTGSGVVAVGMLLLLVVACGPASVPGAATPSSVPASRVLRGPAPAPHFTGLAFPDAADGWLRRRAGRNVAGTGPASAEIWTATGGATWQEQWHGAGMPGSISATDADHAWALITCPSGGGHVLPAELPATADGGRQFPGGWPPSCRARWTRSAFVTDSLGVATVDGCLSDANASRCQGQVLVSRDGGASWTAVLTSHAPVFAAVDPGGQLWGGPDEAGQLPAAGTARFRRHVPDQHGRRAELAAARHGRVRAGDGADPDPPRGRPGRAGLGQPDRPG